MFEKWSEEEADELLRDKKELKILCVTWNLHGKKGPSNLKGLLLGDVKHHIYVIST